MLATELLKKFMFLEYEQETHEYEKSVLVFKISLILL